MSGDLPLRWRFPLLILGILALVGGTLGGLIRIGWSLPAPGTAAALAHGPLMIGAFFGTVIGIERAVALAARWAYLGPLVTGSGGFVLLIGPDPLPGAMLLTGGSLMLVVVCIGIWQRQATLPTLTPALGAVGWAAGNALWLAGAGPATVVPLWLVFLVLTIAGERLELSRFLPPSPIARRIFLALIALMLAGALPPLSTLPPGRLTLPATLLGLALWLFRQDIARRTVREQGLTRFIAICLLSGYAWLAIGALVLLPTGGLAPGTPTYDAGLHAILLGFVMAMVFGHAPLIFPAILGLRLPFSPQFYLPLVVLHGSLLVRVTGALAGAVSLRRGGAMLNAAALALFVFGLIAAAIRGRRLTSR